MIYSKGTIATQSGSPTVTGTGTTWLKRINPGDVLQLASGGSLYLIAKVVSDTSLLLSAHADTTTSGASYVISSDFSRYYSIPYPRSQDIEKASVLRRNTQLVDRLLGRIHDRVFSIEYPAGVPLPLTVTPSIGTVYIAPPAGAVFVSNLTSTPGISAAVVSTPGTVIVSNMDATPAITTVALDAAVNLITADSAVVTADSNTYTADGFNIVPGTPSSFILADSNLVTADAVSTTADGRYTP